MGNLEQKPKKKFRLTSRMLIGLGLITAAATVLIIGALNNFGR
jgi:hypothetical protein